MFAQIAKKAVFALCAVATLVGAESASAKPVIIKDITPVGGLVWQGGGRPCTHGPGYCKRYIIYNMLVAPNPAPPINYTISGPVQLYSFPARQEGDLGVTGDLPIPPAYVPQEGQEVVPTAEIFD
jgi:hypothetical protein